jgi:NAD-dependent DNA ligase
MKIQIPTHCPTCATTLVLINEQLFCKNSACPDQLNKKLEHFCKTLGIKGMGQKTVEKLQLESIAELFYLDRDAAIHSLGSEKVVDKLLGEISRAKLAPLASVIASFSIPLIGNTAGTKLSQVVKNLDEINQETCKQAGLGDKATANILEWLETEYQELKDFLPFTFENSSTVSNDAIPICITGKLKSFKTKAEAAEILNSLGYKVTDNVTKQTQYLVDEENKQSSKRKKAEEYLIPIITNLNDFIQEKVNTHV